MPHKANPAQYNQSPPGPQRLMLPVHIGPLRTARLDYRRGDLHIEVITMDNAPHEERLIIVKVNDVYYKYCQIEPTTTPEEGLNMVMLLVFKELKEEPGREIRKQIANELIPMAILDVMDEMEN